MEVMMNKYLICNKLSKTYGQGEIACQALKDVTFKAEPGELIAICGKSGSGKTTLFNILSGFDADYQGEAIVLEKDMKKRTEEVRSQIRSSSVGLISQNYNLIPFLTVKENAELPLMIQSARKNEKKTMEVLRSLELEKKARSFPHELSGGQKQRNAIARIQLQNPKVILADEPTGSLDPMNAERVIHWLQNEARTGKLVVMITHDQDLADQCDRILRMENGVLHET